MKRVFEHCESLCVGRLIEFDFFLFEPLKIRVLWNEEVPCRPPRERTNSTYYICVSRNKDGFCILEDLVAKGLILPSTAPHRLIVTRVWEKRKQLRVTNDTISHNSDVLNSDYVIKKPQKIFFKQDLFTRRRNTGGYFVLITTAESFSLSAIAQLRCHGRRPFESCRQKSQSGERKREMEPEEPEEGVSMTSSVPMEDMDVISRIGRKRLNCPISRSLNHHHYEN